MDPKEDKMNQMLSAATSVFAECGYAGARMDVIARRAGVNKATIYYNIGNKEKLYEAVIQATFGRELSQTGERIRQTETPEEKIRVYVQGIADALERNPAIPNIMMWEHASGGKSLTDVIAVEIATLIRNLTAILDEGVTRGVFKKVNPMLIQFMVVPGLMFYKTSSPIRNGHAAFPDEARKLPASVSETFAKEMAAFILDGLKSTGPTA